jgi:hypothetical protein
LPIYQIVEVSAGDTGTVEVAGLTERSRIGAAKTVGLAIHEVEIVQRPNGAIQASTLRYSKRRYALNTHSTILTHPTISNSHSTPQTTSITHPIQIKPPHAFQTPTDLAIGTLSINSTCLASSCRIEVISFLALAATSITRTVLAVGDEVRAAD